MKEEILFSGFGGQGIMLMGKLLAEAANAENKRVTWLPAYGAEVRGGTAYCVVKISDQEIASPLLSQPSACVVMNEPSLKKYEGRLKKDGLLIINSSLIKIKPQRKDVEILLIPCTDLAQEAGNIKVANMVALAALLAKSKVVKVETLKAILKREAVANKKEALLAVNEKAIEEGLKYKQK
jgi:2-oxoglutarate ferredoxin oxidoreductase subunit gamma